MVNEIEAQLDADQSRSTWIAKAIAKELSGEYQFNTFRDGTAMHMFNLFKEKMRREGVKIDIMFLELIEKNINDASQGND